MLDSRRHNVRVRLTNTLLDLANTHTHTQRERERERLAAIHELVNAAVID